MYIVRTNIVANIPYGTPNNKLAGLDQLSFMKRSFGSTGCTFAALQLQGSWIGSTGSGMYPCSTPSSILVEMGIPDCGWSSVKNVHELSAATRYKPRTAQFSALHQLLPIVTSCNGHGTGNQGRTEVSLYRDFCQVKPLDSLGNMEACL